MFPAARPTALSSLTSHEEDSKMGIRLGCVSRRLFPSAVIGLAVLLMLTGFAGTVDGQTTTGTITGTVTDQKGAAMAGVNITAHNSDTGVETPAVRSTDSGIYTISQLPPGNYDVTATQAGFATVQSKGVKVQVGQTLRVDVEMPIAATQSLVTVTTEVPLVETEKTEQSQVVSESQVANLPISSRRWEQYVLLTPGVVPDGAGGNIAFHGLNSMYNNNAVDGANNNNAYNSTARGNANAGSSGIDGYSYSSDAIREFQVASNNYSSELGQAAGGQVNAVTKSGTNTMHGDVFYNMRNQIFNALDPAIVASTPAGQTPTQSIHQQNQFGGSVGGPVLKDKLFYFINYDGYRKVTPIAYTTSNPIAGLPCPVVASFAANPGGVTQAAMNAQCAAAKNWVSTSEIGVFARELRQDIGFGKFDYQLNQANHINAGFTWRNWNIPRGTAFASSQNSGLTANSDNFIQDRFVIVTWNTIIGSNKVNELRYQFGEDHAFQLWNGPPPNVGLSNIFAYGQNNANPQRIYEDRNQVSDSVSFSKGKHSFKAGVDINLIHELAHISISSSGVYSYSGNGVALPAGVCPATSAATNWCDWVIDLYGVDVGDKYLLADGVTLASKKGLHWGSFQQQKDQRFPGNVLNPAGAGIDDFMDDDYAGFFQDTWKLRSNLTINMGLRYDVQIYPPLPNPNSNTPLVKYYTSTMNIDYGGIQPRLGVAWNLAKNTVVRVGFGTFFAKSTNSTISSIRRTSGEREQIFNCSTSNTSAGGPASGSNSCGGLRFPNVLFAQMAAGPAAPFSDSTLGAAGTVGGNPLTPSVLNPGGDACAFAPTSCAVRGIDPTAVRPRAYEGEASIERQLPWNMSFTGSYIFTHAAHLPSHYDSNLTAPTTTKTYDVVDTTGATVLTSTVPFFTGPRLDPTAGLILAEHTVINSTYHAMALSLRKPTSHGVEVLATYTLAKATDNGEAGGASGGLFLGGEPVLNPYNLQGEYATSNIDVRNRFTGSVIYAPTFTKNLSNRIERGVADGWSVATTVTATNGQPYSGQITTTTAQCLTKGQVGGTGASACVGTPGLDGGMTAATLSSSANLAGGRIAWMPRNSFRLPGYSNVDLRLAKQFTLRDRYNFEFRAEAFNLFNSTILQAVNTGAYAFVAPGAAGCPATHTNTCVVPQSTFQQSATTSSFLLGARQMQFGFRFGF
jgi:hypothetical protein